MKRRILSILCVLALCLGLLPSAAFAAGTDTGKSIQLADSETAANIGGGQADNIYFGNYFQSSSTTKEPVKWRVLSNSDGKLFLLSDQNLDVKPYNSSSTGITWEKSTIRSWLNGYAASENNSGTDYSSNNFIDAAFSSDEQVAIADTYVYNKNDPSYSTSGGEDTTDQIFLLSIEEANNSSYFPNGSNSRKSTNTAYVASYSGMLGAGKADYWWLRSPGEDDDCAAFVDDGGVVYNNGYIVVHTNTAVRPAFNLNLNSVLFTSAAAGGKSASGMDSGLTAVGGYDGNEWKLTLLDSSRNFSVTEETASGKPGDTITLNYTGASTGANENISVILADDSGAQYYGRIAKPTTADGQVKITIPASLADGTYTLNVFSEQYNGGENDDTKLTDYASAFEAVTLTVDTTAPTLSNGSATRDSETTATVKFTSDEAGEYYYTVVESGATEPTDIVSGDGTNMASGENTITLTNLAEGAKDIYIVAKDAMGNVSQTLQIVIPEFIPTYTISASPAALNFSNKTVGYTEAPDAKTVTITNTGNQEVTVTLPTGTNYTITAGTGFADGTATLAPNGTATFAVQPKTGLAVGSYSETLTISSNHNTSAEVSLAFTVDPKSLDGAQVQVSGSYIYDGNAKEPSGENVTVTLHGEPLTENTDYTLSYEDNTDAGEATVKVSGTGNYSGTVTGTFQIAKATPTVSDVAVSSPATIYASTDISAITLTYTGTEGTVALDAGQTLTVGEGTYNWTFTPTDTTNYTTATGSITLTVAVDTVQSITVFTAPTKTTYTYGDSFDKTGMEVTATYASGETKDVTEDVTITPTELTVDVTTVTISYGGQTTTQGITVNPKEISITSATVQDKTYDGGTDATVGTVTFTGLVNGESLTSGTDYTATAAFTDKNAGDSKQATVTVELKNGNYTFANSEKTATANATAKISPLAVALSWSTPTSFTYDGTEKSVTASITNAVSGDDVSVAYDSNSTTKATAANEYTATASGLSGNDANNYTLTGADNLSQSWSIGGASIAGATVELSGTAFTYNGQSQKPTVTVKLNGNTLNANTDYTVDFGGDSINAGTYTVTVTGTGNYSGTATSKPTYTIHKAAQAALTITSTSDATYGQDYTLTTSGGSGSGAVTITVSNGTGAATVSGYTLTPTKAGTVTVTAVKAGDNNYNDGTSVSATITINKGTYDGTTTATGSVLANWPGEVELPGLPDGASYGEPSSNDVTGMSITGGVLHYTGGSGIVKDQTYTVTVPVAGATNYNDYQITVTLTGTDKQVLTITGVTAQNGTYNGQTQAGYTGTPSAQGYTGDFTVTYNTEDGKAPTNAGTYSVTIAIPDTDPQYVGSIVLEFTIAKKALTVSAPSASVYVGDNAPLLALTYTGLVDGESVTPSEAPAFTITKSDDTEIALADAVKTAGTYTITWSNADQGFTGDENYDIQTETAGTLTVSTRSSGGGSSSNITTETTKNPDGSTTITVTNKVTGTVTETTKFPDGSKEVVETTKDGTVTTTTTDTAGNKTQVVENTDGSSKTTVDNKDGSGSVTVVDENGQVVSEATLSQSAVAAAQEKGEAVALPMPEVPVTTDRENAPTVTVDLPSGTSAKVEIPVAEVTPGTVAVIVKADGTEEVIKTSLTTENGVAVTLSDGDTVKIVDNSKTFDDVADNYWGAEAVDFAVSRELFAGTSATTFAPDTAMTRAMIVTVLARFEGVDTTTGSTWYEAGQQWAMENGVSDGTNMDASLTREQLATMLYRYAQSKGYDTTQGGMAIREYADFEQISDYAVEAMTWAVNTGLISGTSTTTLSPQGLATRAQVATILMRFIEGMA